jgi:peptide/nickel transport system permease protein
MVSSTTPDRFVPSTYVIPEDIGLLRRIWRGRIWYGTEWYLAATGALILTAMIIMTLFAPLLAPYDPNEFVGGPFTPPGGGLQALLARSGESPVQAGDSLEGVTIGVTRNSNSRKVADALNAKAMQYMLPGESEAALAAGEIDLIFIDQTTVPQALATYPELEVVQQDLGNKYTLGTDNLGRDILSRIIWGARTILTVALLSAALSSGVGIPLGLISGFISGPLDRVLSLVMDSIYSFPGLLLAVALAAMLGPGLVNVAVAISVIYIPTFFRVVRGQTLSVKEELFVEAAHSLGARPFDILARYIFPNVIPSVVVVFSLNVADTILTEAGLSFVGLGLPPDIPDWGYDLSKGHQFLVAGRWWMITFPGIMITLVAMGFSLLGESLSEILNPRLAEK